VSEFVNFIVSELEQCRCSTGNSSVVGIVGVVDTGKRIRLSGLIVPGISAVEGEPDVNSFELILVEELSDFGAIDNVRESVLEGHSKHDVEGGDTDVRLDGSD